MSERMTQLSKKIYYHFSPARYALCDIKKRQLKVTTFDDVNDPFELLGINLGNREARKELRHWRDRMKEKYGMLCFSDGWRNPLLWSHYGDKHHGIGLGFCVDQLREVIYCQERLAWANWNPAKDLQPILWTKFQHWKYEAEHRRLVLLSECRPETKGGKRYYFWPFDSDLQLRKVVVGANCTTDFGRLRQVLGELRDSVEMIKARVAFQSFDVVHRKDLGGGGL